MKPSFVVYLLLLSLILTKSQGIRLEKGSLAFQQHKQHHGEESALLKRSNTDSSEEAIICKDEECTGKIKNRKLVTTSVSTIHTISKNVKNNGGNEAESLVNGNTRNVRVNGAEEVKEKMLATSSKSKDHTKEHYPDDIVEMDYSPARRKPPIHN